MLLVVALIAVCFAWQRAVHESTLAERQRQRWKLEHELAIQQNGHDHHHGALKLTMDDDERQRIAKELSESDVRMSEIRTQLDALAP